MRTPRRVACFLATLVVYACHAEIESDPGSREPDAGTGGSGGGGGDPGGPGGTGGGSDAGATDALSEAAPPPGGAVSPPLGASSSGTGGKQESGTVKTTPGGVEYRVIAPSPTSKMPLMIVFSGTEGGAQMTSNLRGTLSNVVFGVLDGVRYRGQGAAGASVLDELRKRYDIDNDRTYLLGESAGTTAALELGFDLRQSFFAAFWANDVNARATPKKTAASLGFAPWGNAGPGGDLPDAKAIIDRMKAAGYRFDGPSPYDGPGSKEHGAPEQFLAAIRWFKGKSRQ